MKGIKHMILDTKRRKITFGLYSDGKWYEELNDGKTLLNSSLTKHNVINEAYSDLKSLEGQITSDSGPVVNKIINILEDPGVTVSIRGTFELDNQGRMTLTPTSVKLIFNGWRDHIGVPEEYANLLKDVNQYAIGG
jgi:hypothetical protein